MKIRSPSRTSWHNIDVPSAMPLLDKIYLRDTRSSQASTAKCGGVKLLESWKHIKDLRKPIESTQTENDELKISRANIDWCALPSRFLRVVPILVPPLPSLLPSFSFLALLPKPSSAALSSSPSPFLVVPALPTGILHSSTPKSVVFYFLPFFLTLALTHTCTCTSIVRHF